MNAELHGRVMRPFQLLLGVLVVAGSLMVGCEKREKVFELESPGLDVEVEKSDGAVDVNVDSGPQGEEEPIQGQP